MALDSTAESTRSPASEPRDSRSEDPKFAEGAERSSKECPNIRCDDKRMRDCKYDKRTSFLRDKREMPSLTSRSDVSRALKLINLSVY